MALDAHRIAEAERRITAATGAAGQLPARHDRHERFVELLQVQSGSKSHVGI
jgi:hypothetical protein